MERLQTESSYQIAVGRNALGPTRVRGEKLYVTTQPAAFACRDGTSSLRVRHVHVTTQHTACAYDNRMPPVNMSHVHTTTALYHSMWHMYKRALISI